MRGTMEKMQNLTVGPYCKFVVHNSTETKFEYDHVVVQTRGFLAIDREDQALVTVTGKTLDIRGGGKVRTCHPLLFQLRIVFKLLLVVPVFLLEIYHELSRRI